MPPLTEQDIFTLLKKHYAGSSNGDGTSVVIPQVRSDAAFKSRRTLDALAMGLWPSRGLWLTGFEIKCSRADWSRELKKPEKAEEFADKVDFIYVVQAAEGIVQPGELPHHWGLMTVKGNRIVQTTAAKFLAGEGGPNRPLPEGFNRGFLVAILRQAARQGAATPEAIREAVKAEREMQERLREDGVAGYKDRAEKLTQAIRDFERAAGVSMRHEFGWGHNAEDIGKAVRMVLDGDKTVKRLEDRLRRLRTAADGIVKEIDEQIDFYEEDNQIADGG